MEKVFQKLKLWGIEEVGFLRENGELDLEEYCKYLGGFRNNEYLGELSLVGLSKLDLEGVKVGVFSAPMGFGHHRLSRYYEIFLKTLGVAVEHIDLGNSGENLRVMKFFSSLKTAYVNGSNKTAVETGLSQYAEWLSYDRHTWFTKALRIWEEHCPEHFYNTFMGKPGKHLTPANTRRTFGVLNTLFGKELRRYLKQRGITHKLVLYPMVNALVGKKNTILIGTDSVLEPAGWIPDPLLVVETDYAKNRLVKAWRGKMGQNIHVSKGFPAPVGALIRRSELTKKRAEAIPLGEPQILFLPASGVATAQLKSFTDILVEVAPLLDQGKLKVVVQAGAEGLGKKVHDSLSTLVEQLSSEYPGLMKNVVIHHGQTVRAALDLFEVVAASGKPMSIAVKGSEMARIAVQLGIPHIVTGTIGEHEKWNVIVSALQGAAVIVLPTAFDECWRLVESSDFPENLRWPAWFALERVYCHTMTDALIRSEEVIRKGRLVETNGQMMVETIEMLVRKGH